MFRVLRNVLEQFGHYIAILLFIVLVNFYFFIPNGTLIIALFIAFALGFFMLMRLKESIQLLSFLIPLTIPLALNENTKLNLPSELMAAFLCPVFVMRTFISNPSSKNIFKHPLSILLVLDLAWMLITSLTSEIPIVSIKRCLIRFVYLCVYFGLFSEFVGNYNQFRTIMRNFALGTLIPIASTFAVHFKYGFNPTVAPDAPKPFFNDHTIYGAVIAFLIPFLFYESFISQNKNRIGFIALCVIFILAEFISFSRAAWISLISLLPLYLMLRLRISFITLSLFSIVVAGIGFSQKEFLAEKFFSSKAVSHNTDTFQHLQSVQNISSDVSNKERINRWKCALRMFNEKPHFGYGPGTYQFIYGQFQVRNEITYISTFHGTKGHAHNEFLNYLSETGWPGFLVFAIWVFYSIYLALSHYYKSDNKNKSILIIVLFSLCTFYIHSLFNGFIETDKMMSLVLITLAFLVRLSQNTELYGEEKKHYNS
jgi:O-antigen ligase